MENIKVVKFGGTSVGDLDRINNVAKLVKEMAQESKVVVVVSAMAGETDRLIRLAKSVCSNPVDRDLDQLVATGELVSASLLSIALNSIGTRAVSLSSHQVKIITDSNFTGAKIMDISADKLIQLLDSGIIPVVAGFQGVDPEGNVTTLGRGGSDTTAVAIACALKEKFPNIMCEIYTDVDGVYSVDPRLVSNAKKLSCVTYDEMLELASSGAKVLHPRSVALANKYNLPVVVKSTFVRSSGTLVGDKSMEEMPVVGISVDQNQCLMTFTNESFEEVISLFNELQDTVIDVVSLVRLGNRFYTGITFSRDSKERALKAFNRVKVKPDMETECAKVTLVGLGMMTQSGVVRRIVHRLQANAISVFAISTSEIKISVVIDPERAAQACNILAEEFELAV